MISQQTQQAQNKTISDWLFAVEQGGLSLPRFQRGEAWNYQTIFTAMKAVIDGLPLGSFLVLANQGDQKFVADRKSVV